MRPPNADHVEIEREAALMIHMANLSLLTPERAQNGKLPKLEEIKAAAKRTIMESSDEQRTADAIAAAVELGHASGARPAVPDVD